MEKKSIKLINNDKIAPIVFEVGVVLELIVMMTDLCASWTLPYRGRVTHVAFILFCIKILMTKYEYNKVPIMVLLGVLGAASYFTCGDEYVIRAVVFVIASKDVNYDRVLRIVLYGTLIGSAIIILLSLLGICGEIVDVRHYGRGIEEARYCLGFNHANNLHDILWYIISIYILVRRKKIGWIELTVMMAFNLGLYVLTISRTGVITTQLVIVCVFLTRYSTRIRDGLAMQTLAILSLVASIALTIYGSTYNIGEREFVKIVDKMLTGRLEMLTEHANIKQWQMFPASRSAEFVDNGFSTITYCYGTVVGAVFVIIIIYELFCLIRSKESIISIIMLGAILVTFMESTFIINISLLCNMILLVIILGFDAENKRNKV